MKRIKYGCRAVLACVSIVRSFDTIRFDVLSKGPYLRAAIQRTQPISNFLSTVAQNLLLNTDLIQNLRTCYISGKGFVKGRSIFYLVRNQGFIRENLYGVTMTSKTGKKSCEIRFVDPS
jgi:hypothetical protein